MPKDRPWPATSSKQNFHGSISKIDKSKERKKSKDPILKLLPALVLLKIIMSRASNVSATKKKDPNYTWLCSAPFPPRWNRGDKQGGTRVAFFWVEKKEERSEFSWWVLRFSGQWRDIRKGNYWRYTHLFHWTIYSWEGRVRFFSKEGKDMSNSIRSIGDSHEKRTIPLSTRIS